MSENLKDQSVGLGTFQNTNMQRKITIGEAFAVLLSLVWLGGCAIFFLVLGHEFTPQTGTEQSLDPFRFIMTALAIFMPVAILWVATTAIRSARIMREESARLQAAIDGMRHTYLQQQQNGTIVQGPSNVERKLDQLAQAQRQTESAIATFTSTRQEPRSMAKNAPAQSEPKAAQVSAPSLATHQPMLELGTQAGELNPPLSLEDFICAMHFPENADDQEGFRALRRALQDHKIAGLVRAAQDVLTLLSQDGIYMDDLRVDMARPEFWRKFSAGERGGAIAPLGGIRDRSSLALTAGRMRKDPVFRDAAHHFLRRFDQIYTGFEQGATDQDIAAMAETRTAKAFMLLGRVTGTFD